MLAVCVQHEMDHLDGKLFVDYLSPLKREMVRKKLAKARRQAAAARGWQWPSDQERKAGHRQAARPVTQRLWSRGNEVENYVPQTCFCAEWPPLQRPRKGDTSPERYKLREVPEPAS